MIIPTFDRRRLTVKPLPERKHDLNLSSINQLGSIDVTETNKEIKQTAEHVIHAKNKRASIILMMGAHVIRSGCAKLFD